MESKNLDMARKVVEAYRKTFPIKEFDAVKQVVKTFKEKHLERFKKELEKEKLEEQRQFDKARLLLEKFKSTDIYKKAISYDLFRILKVNVLENDISNVVASIIDPSKSSFGKDILMKLLKNTKLKDPENIKIKRIYKIIKNTPKNRFVCRREYPGESSRIDIRIFTKNFDIDNIVIDFEMKTEGGSETTKDGESQTKREYKALVKFAKSKTIPVKNILAFFVTPGSGPIAKEFIPLAMDKLRDIILSVLKDRKKTGSSNFDECAIGAICHFFKSGYIF